MQLRDYLRRLTPASELGQGMIEYALIVGVVVLGLLVGYQATPLGGAVSGVFTSVRNQLAGS